jgi:hypothetical protein
MAVTFHSKQNRFPLRPQITFKNKYIVCNKELRFVGIYIKENLKWNAHVQL